MRDTIDMAREVYGAHTEWSGAPLDRLEQLVALVRADQRQIDAKVVEEFARKWWKIHCDSNLHYSSTLKAHQDFCALQAAIRNRGKK
jgi:hypothetical protein